MKRSRRVPLLLFALGLVAGVVAAVVTKDWEWALVLGLAGGISGIAWDSFTDPPDSRGGGSSDAINFGN